MIHDLLDGRTTLAKIAEDLEHIFPGSGQQKRAYLVDLVLALGAGAFVDSVRLGKPPDARRIRPLSNQAHVWRSNSALTEER